MAEFWRALKTLKALQAEPALCRAADRRRSRAGGTGPSWPRRRRARAAAPTRSAPRACRSPRAERTRAPHGLRAARTAHGRPRPARAARHPRRPEPNEPERAPRAPSTSPHPRRQPVAALRLDPICRCSSRARRCSARSEVRFLNLGLSRFRGGSGRPDHRRQSPRRSIDGAACRSRRESFFAPGMNLAGSVRWRIGAEKRLFGDRHRCSHRWAKLASKVGRRPIKAGAPAISSRSLRRTASAKRS